jgi:hypothetical protein
MADEFDDGDDNFDDDDGRCPDCGAGSDEHCDALCPSWDGEDDDAD